jgi:predicted DNA-binding transcriptional regulator AlpA
MIAARIVEATGLSKPTVYRVVRQIKTAA